MRMLVATTNAGKLRDFRAAARLFAVEIETVPGLEEIDAPNEIAATFEGNASLKARYYSRFAPGELVIADDSGLEVAALDNKPGVRSARYSEDILAKGGLSPVKMAALTLDGRNNVCLLKTMETVQERRARYWCALAVARDGVLVKVSEGSLDGEILREQRGAGGFGYDPLFWLPERKKTMAEVDMETRLELSHRGRALRAMLAAMQ